MLEKYKILSSKKGYVKKVSKAVYSSSLWAWRATLLFAVFVVASGELTYICSRGRRLYMRDTLLAGVLVLFALHGLESEELYIV